MELVQELPEDVIMIIIGILDGNMNGVSKRINALIASYYGSIGLTDPAAQKLARMLYKTINGNDVHPFIFSTLPDFNNITVQDAMIKFANKLHITLFKSIFRLAHDEILRNNLNDKYIDKYDPIIVYNAITSILLGGEDFYLDPLELDWRPPDNEKVIDEKLNVARFVIKVFNMLCCMVDIDTETVLVNNTHGILCPNCDVLNCIKCDNCPTIDNYKYIFSALCYTIIEPRINWFYL